MTRRLVLLLALLVVPSVRAGDVEAIQFLLARGATLTRASDRPGHPVVSFDLSQARLVKNEDLKATPWPH